MTSDDLRRILTIVGDCCPDTPEGKSTFERICRELSDYEPFRRRELLSINQACKRISVSRRTIYNWINAGSIEYTRTAGNCVRVFADSLWKGPNDPARETD